ncbi:MAG: ABC transporter permease [Dehalococcoidia bacterium]|nr:ABC transporter permease [Dehalococcoidia bacterium]
MVRFLPGDPAAYILGEGAQQQAIDALRAELGLTDSIPVQYWRYLGEPGDLRTSGSRSSAASTVTTIIWNAVPTTLFLGGISLVLGFLIAVPLGTMAAYFTSKGKNTMDQLTTGSALMMDVVPGFWLALIFMLILSLHLGWLPATGTGRMERPGIAREAHGPPGHHAHTRSGGHHRPSHPYRGPRHPRRRLRPDRPFHGLAGDDRALPPRIA